MAGSHSYQWCQKGHLAEIAPMRKSPTLCTSLQAM